ncbi:MAG: hypothetical protein GX770_00880 [Firmicutes bacterium]|nr:hypothetical protein [Bacillota bacterium]
MMDKNPDLSLLYRYQEARRRLTACEGELAAWQGQKVLADLKNQVQTAHQAAERLKAECNRLKKENRRLEGECRDYEAQLHDLETTLYSGKISAPKELEQLQRRIAEYQTAKTEREEKILNQLYLLETKEQELTAAQKQVEALEAKLTAATGDVTQRVHALQERCTELQKEVEDLDRALPENLKGFYQRSVKVLKGVVVVPIKEKTCGFCHMIIPPAVLEKVKKGGSGVMLCENCGRGLFEQK